MSDTGKVLDHLDGQRGAALERLFAFLRIPSISADPAFRAECRKAGEWLTADLVSIGFDASLRDTPGHPMVVAHWKSKTGAKRPHILFYGHYDVQPVDPLELWNTEPFNPHLADGPHGPQIIGRGAADDKGQLMTFVEAARAYVAVHGDLPVDVTILAEGEEESGSPSLAGFLDAHKAELSRDIAFVCDTGMWDHQTPAITTMLRGLAFEEVVIHAADRDLHSGMFGGAAVNPIHVLGRIIGDLHDARGRITIPGFYDGVDELPDEIRAMWDSLGFDEGKFLGEIGLSKPAGEQDHPGLPHIWSRPTAEVNGIIGGYTGEGSKTVIAAQASAKFSFRLVFRQDPDKVLAAFHAFVQARVPADCRVEFKGGRGSPATVIPHDGRELRSTLAALGEEWPKPAVVIGCGGSIPIVGAFRKTLGMDTVLVGFGLDDDRIHSPNEKYELTSFEKGARSWVRILAHLAGNA